MIYLEGDFSVALEEFQEPQGMYNLYFNNCAQKTLRTLSKADTVYSTALKKASKKVLPSSAFNTLADNVAVIDTALSIVNEVINALSFIWRGDK